MIASLAPKHIWESDLIIAELAKSKNVQSVFVERIPDILCQCLDLWDAKPPLHRFVLEADVVPSNFDNLATILPLNFAIGIDML